MKIFAAALIVLAFPATAWGEATLVTREVPLPGSGRLRRLSAPERFNLVGLHWKGPGSVELRVRRTSGWSSWREVEAEAEDRPDSGSRRRAGCEAGGSARSSGRVRRGASRCECAAGSAGCANRLGRSLQMAGSPAIITRKAWGADERIRRDSPSFARR